MKRACMPVALTLALVGCSQVAPTRQDTLGHYATTSDYRSMQRVELEIAMEEGLRDFDTRLEDLREQASLVGEDGVEEYAGALEDIETARRRFVAELSRLRTTRSGDWHDVREDVVDAYEEMRELLDEAFEEVVEEAS